MLVEFGGIGHTAVLYIDARKYKDKVDYFGSRMKTGRIIVNMPASQGAIGDIYNFKLSASLTLGFTTGSLTPSLRKSSIK
jgi:acetaldehyde dehydrogenase/alcohol dehydrogenase